jgi:hypothetical protein
MYGPEPTYGGNMAVIDNAGILWSGSGSIDSSLLWLDTNDVGSSGTVAITHSANILALDMDGAKHSTETNRTQSAPFGMLVFLLYNQIFFF